MTRFGGTLAKPDPLSRHIRISQETINCLAKGMEILAGLDGTERVERRSKDLKTRGICGEADPALGSGALDDILAYSRTEDI